MPRSRTGAFLGQRAVDQRRPAASSAAGRPEAAARQQGQALAEQRLGGLVDRHQRAFRVDHHGRLGDEVEGDGLQGSPAPGRPPSIAHADLGHTVAQSPLDAHFTRTPIAWFLGILCSAVKPGLARAQPVMRTAHGILSRDRRRRGRRARRAGRGQAVADAGRARRWCAGRPRRCWRAGADELVVVIADGQQDRAHEALAGLAGWRLALGGAARSDSVKAGLAALAAHRTMPVVLIHDAARPLLPARARARACSPRWPTCAGRHPGPAARRHAEARRWRGRIAETPPRAGLWRAQTPQALPARRAEGRLRRLAGGRRADRRGDRARARRRRAWRWFPAIRRSPSSPIRRTSPWPS